MDKHERVFLGLGSNKDDRASNLLGAINALKGLSGTTLVACSAFVETEPWGVIDQPRFLNAVVEIRTALEPFDLLSAVKRIERELDRQPTYRWGPRKIDIDILVYGRRRVAASDLTIPHQHATQRDFVMSPLSEIAPEVAARLVDGTWIK